MQRPTMEPRAVAAAHGHWRAGRPLDAGRVLYESLAVEERPPWAAEVLGFAYTSCRIRRTAEIEDVLQIARAPLSESYRWFDAGAAFRAVRHVGLRVEAESARGGQEGRRDRYVGALALAENVAKVTFNAYADLVSRVTRLSDGGPARFDDDAGWWIAANLHAIVTDLGDPALVAAAWSRLSGGAGEAGQD